MDNEHNVYPDFLPNQVLTNNQLNQLREYLDQQNRLGHVRLSGTGIICGLNLTIANNKITVGQGFGLSSDGYLIELGSDDEENSTLTFSHWQNYTDPNLETDGTIAYQHWQKEGNPKAQRDILELVSSANDGAMKITDHQLSGRVLILYLEQKNEHLDSCLVTDCDSKGVNVRFSIRLLLVNKDALEGLSPCESAKGQLIHIPRLHSKLPLAEVEATEQINEAYLAIIKEQIEELISRIKNSYSDYESTLGLDRTDLDSLEKLAKIEVIPNQYTWDILNDIADAYNEFITHACELLSPCFIDHNFPHHLMLGALDGAGIYRNQFVPSQRHKVEHNDIQLAKLLFLRILRLADNITLEKVEQIQITPSHTRLYPLGKRALPFYYSPEIVQYWQPQMCCTTEEVCSYHFPTTLSEFNYSYASFLRIEGHIGTRCDQVIRRIRELQQKLNLEFDLLALNIKHDGESLRSLASDIPGIEHTAGVVKGGTFILLCDEQNNVIADFSLTGQIPCCRYLQQPEQPIKLGSIFGKFIDTKEREFVGGTVVLTRLNSISATKAITGADGMYRFPDLPADTYTVQASINKGQNEDFVSDFITEKLAAGENKQIDLVGKFIEIVKKGVIKGRVLNSNQIGVPNAQVTLTPDNEPQDSGPKGEFEFTDLNPNTYTLQAIAGLPVAAFSTEPVEIRLVSGAIKTVNLNFKANTKKTGDLNVLVKLSGSNKPISTATVSIASIANPRLIKSLKKPTNTRTNYYVFSNINVGEYLVSAQADGYEQSGKKITVVANEPNELVFQLTKSRRIISPGTPDSPVADPRSPFNDPRRPVDPRIFGSAIDPLTETIHDQRIANYQSMLSNIPSSVRRSSSAKLAHDFTQGTIINETDNNVILEQYNKVIDKGLKTLANSKTATANKAHYQTILSTVSLAILDKLIASSPDSLGKNEETVVRKVKQTLEEAGIPLSGFKKQWDAKQLEDELQISSVSEVTAILS